MEIKIAIQNAIANFTELKDDSVNLFKVLGYESSRTMKISKEFFVKKEFSQQKALFEDWLNVELLFQITDSEINQNLNQTNLFDSSLPFDDQEMNSYVFLAVELKNEKYTRTDLSRCTREINKIFPMPVLVLFKYQSKISIAIINRRFNKTDNTKKVLQKVTLIKDISISNPHRAHLEILFDLSFEELCRKQKIKINSFVGLHKAWEEVLDINELNKNFYKEISSWYFWALHNVEFPDDTEKNTETRNAQNLIRLLTRLIFVWFLKEKNLIPENLFDKDAIDKILNFSDKTGSTYYKAILQNLFFATLNTPMNKDKAKSRSFVKGQFLVHNLYRYERFFKDSETALSLFENIPFLNGGLFECLDKEENGKTLRIDCFSENPKNETKLKIPDFLFFQKEETEVDLNNDFGTKGKKFKFRGLLEILKRYKFTVTENTPVEEEIALDPELLGRVFENLLASYNPETKTTARKQTGSFYTPREIVNYMVDESLVAFLSTKLAEKIENYKDEPEEGLRETLSYTEKDHPFKPNEVEALISAINECKILDPACGSGAFPMGILHKLVYLLSKLDPENKNWRKLQTEVAISQTAKAFESGDKKERESRLKEINDAFDLNASDYGRKLFLIENCIYGVDIQPIAIQISKLRFFISLIVDQKENPEKENLGILPLPNLETKLVSANTLIGIEKQSQTNLFNTEVEEIEEKLREVRHKHFQAKTRKTKEKYRKLDQELREKLGEIWRKDLFSEDGKKIANWNPYDQNQSADFFDSELMFGILDGFDVVIGNPPYVQLQKAISEKLKLADLYKKFTYETFERTGDIYSLFYENGINNLNKKGILCFITSNKWMRANYGKSLRKFFSEKNPLKLIDLGPGVFNSATVDTNILIIQNSKMDKSSNLKALTFTQENKIELLKDSDFSKLKNLSEESWLILSPNEQRIKEKIERIGTPLKDWKININSGMKTGFNEAFIIDGKTKDKLISQDPKSAEIIKPILRGRDIKRYRAEFADLWLINTHNGYTDKNGNRIRPINIYDFPAIKVHLDNYFRKLEKRQDKGITPYNLRHCAYVEEFEKEKIVYIEIMTDNPKEGFEFPSFSFKKEEFFVLNTAYIITGESLKLILSVINSKLGKILVKYYVTQLQKRQFRMLNLYVQLFPIPKISESEQEPFISLVDEILTKKEANPNADTSDLEQAIDILVYKLYELTYEEVKIVDPTFPLSVGEFGEEKNN